MTQRAPRHATGKAMGSELVLVALGGLGEIGMNCYLYGLGPESDRKWLMVDLGLTFPDLAVDPGVDVILPDVGFIAERVKSLAGIVITHAHEDHIGAVIDLWPRLKAPIYTTPFAAAMLRAKLTEFSSLVRLPVREVPLGSRFTVGPFDLELITLTHSIPEPNGLAIRTPHGLVIHTGDWKLDADPVIGAPADEAKIQALAAEGIHAVICDSTNAFREGRSPSEADVAKSVAQIVKAAKRRVAVTTFASNVARIKTVADAARAAGRELVVCGRAMHRVIQVAIDTGYLPSGFRWLDQEQFTYLQPDKVLVLCTGSQGEPRAAISRISEDEHPDVVLGKGDCVIFSSRTIPGNEKAVGRVQNNLARLGCEVVTDADALVHVTGHPRRDELRQVYGWLKPKVAIPMHGEIRHLVEHAKLARECGVPDVKAVVNGDIVRIAPGPALIVDEAPVGRQFRDGRLIVGDGDGPVRERRKLSFVGIVAVSLVVNRRGEVMGEPQAELDGVPDSGIDGYAMQDRVLDAISGCLKSMPVAKRRETEILREAVRRSVRSAVDEVWGKKPIVKVLITVVDARG